MVSEDEVAPFQHVAKVFNDLVDGQQLVTIGAAFLLGWVQLFGEES
jgi:hypothetical protein